MPTRCHRLLFALAAASAGFGQSVDIPALTREVQALRQRSVAPTPEFRQAVEARAAALSRLIATNPRLALDSAMPEFQAAEIRPWAPALVEVTGDWEGPLEVRVEDDFENGVSRKHYLLQVDGEELEVFPADPLPEQACEPTVRISGLRLGARVAASAVTIRQGPLQATSCSTTGVQNIAVILVNFTSTALPLNITPSFVQNAFFGAARSMDTYWRETSYNRASATGQVFGPFTIADTPCGNSSTIRSSAITAADAAVDFRNYTRIFIVHPLSGSCSIGLGSIGCSSLSSLDGTFVASTSWLRADYLSTTDHVISVGVHEGGHNMALHHASTLDFGAQALGAPGAAGTYNEYWDVFSAMGLSYNLGGTLLIGHYSGQDKVTLGWLTATEYRTVTLGGTFTLIPYEGAATGLKALKVTRPGTNKFLWLEYRQSLGAFDTSLSRYSSTIYNGALIHYDDPNDSYGTQTMLLDFTPSATPNTFSNAPLVSGASWTDPNSALGISVGTANASGLTVTITLPTSSCDLNTDTSVNVSDVQLSANKALGMAACGTGDLDGNTVCNVVDLQRVVTAALGGVCRVGL